MTDWLNRLILAANGRPFSADEGERIAAYAESLPDRLRAVKVLEDAHKWLSRQFADAVTDKAAEWRLPRDPFARDFCDGLTAVGHACLADDPGLLCQSVGRPLAGLADALDVPRDDLADLFDTAFALLAKRADAGSAAVLRPYFAAAARAVRGDPEVAPAAAVPDPDPDPELALPVPGV